MGLGTCVGGVGGAGLRLLALFWAHPLTRMSPGQMAVGCGAGQEGGMFRCFGGPVLWGPVLLGSVLLGLFLG